MHPLHPGCQTSPYRCNLVCMINETDSFLRCKAGDPKTLVKGSFFILTTPKNCIGYLKNKNYKNA